MPASEQSVQVTSRYQDALARLQAQAGAVAQARWSQINPSNLRGSYQPWLQQAVPAVIAAQRTAVTLSSAYLAAYTSSETGEQVSPRPAETAQYAGQTPAQVTVAHALEGTLWAMLARIKHHDHKVAFEVTVAAALTWGLTRNVRLAAESASYAARSALSDLLNAQKDRYEGWRRVARPTACVACLVAANGQIEPLSAPFRLHPHCSCVQQPVIRGVAETVRQLTGHEIFRSLSDSEQAALAGENAAKQLRDGRLSFDDLLKVNRMDAQPDQIQERPVH